MRPFMRTFRRLCSSTVTVVGLSTAQAQPFPDAATLPAQTSLPDPLTLFDGRTVSTRDQWVKQRRPELQAMFEHYMYGALPPKPERVEFKLETSHADFLAGKATMKIVTISFGSTQAPRIDLLLIVPNQGPKPAPVFVGMNFCGNHAILDDPRVPLARGWLYPSCKGCPEGKATEAARGSQASDWPLAEIIDRGYALATFCTSDVDSDRGNVSDGVYAWLARGDATKAQPAHRGSIAAWAWGFHRAVDYLMTDPAIDPKRIAVVGHSRNGKTALLAAAFDERIALAIPHQAGCGGSAPSRGKIGESVKQINDHFPHWFNAEFKKFNEQPDRLPFDQHCLVALCAPRPVLLSNAVEDQWANPNGQFEVLRAAEPVYRLLKAGGLKTTQVPEPGQLINSTLGYYIRPGKHSMTKEDWRIFLDFADKQLGRASSK